MTEPSVSVVLPTYNRAGTLARAIQSVLAQTHQDLELIVVDDASSDETAKVVQRFHDPRLRYEPSAERLGVSRARNLGCGMARGEFIAFQDSDDEWRVEKLAKQLQVLRDAGPAAVLVVCGDIVVNNYSSSYLGVDSAESSLDITQMSVLRLPGASCWLARKASLLEVGGFNEQLNCFEDWELSLRLSERGRVMMVNEPLAVRQKTPNSLFQTERNYAPNLKRILALHERRLRAHPRVWAHSCNLIGQTECQYGSSREARRWFLQALAVRPFAPRGWVNLVMSFLGASVFRGYVQFSRAWRSRFAAPVRPVLYTGSG